jgi:hypothetical protein
VNAVLEPAHDPAAEIVFGAGDPEHVAHGQVSQMGEVHINLVKDDHHRGILAPLPGPDRRPPKPKCVNHFIQKMVSQLTWSHRYWHRFEVCWRLLRIVGLIQSSIRVNLFANAAFRKVAAAE